MRALNIKIVSQKSSVAIFWANAVSDSYKAFRKVQDLSILPGSRITGRDGTGIIHIVVSKTTVVTNKMKIRGHGAVCSVSKKKIISKIFKN